MTVKRREYDASKDGNVFDWLLEECERQRHWHKVKREPVKPKPVLQSLRGFNNRNASHCLKLDKSGPDEAPKHVFEVSQARKL